MTLDTRNRDADRTRPQQGNGSDDDADDADDDVDSGASGGQQGSDPGDAGSDDDQRDPDYRALYERERRIRRRYEREATRARERERTQRDGQSTADDEARRENDTLREELRRERAYNRIVRVATDEGAIDPDAVATMLLAADEVDFDDEGRPRDVQASVRDLLDRKRYLRSARSTDNRERRPSGDAGRGRKAEGNGDGETGSDWNRAFRRAAARSRTEG